MHDPMTVAFEVRRPWPHLTRDDFERRLYGRFHWPSWITIWHVDPERDGTDDSCGWFKRAKHGDPAILKAIESDFAFHWDASWGGWFTASGAPRYSTAGITLAMFFQAARICFKGRGDQHGWRRGRRFVRRHLFDILSFAENPCDSLETFITQRYGVTPRDQRIKEAASIVYGCILRWSQPWYRHARWHVWHWQFQIHPLLAFKRWAFSRCAGCGRRFKWGYAPVTGQWNGTGPLWFRTERGVFHDRCYPAPTPQVRS